MRHYAYVATASFHVLPQPALHFHKTEATSQMVSMFESEQSSERVGGRNYDVKINYCYFKCFICVHVDHRNSDACRMEKMSAIYFVSFVKDEFLFQ